MNFKILAIVAVVLLVIWIVLRVALAITSGLLHLLWIGALIFLAVIAWRKVKGVWNRRRS